MWKKTQSINKFFHEAVYKVPNQKIVSHFFFEVRFHLFDFISVVFDTEYC